MKKALLIFGLCFVLLCTGIYFVSSPKTNSPSTVTASSWDDWAHLPDPGGSGLGTETSPFIIRNTTDLSNRLPTASNAAQNQHFILMSDITLSGDWNPRFLTSGSVFDGNNYRISGLRIRQAAATTAGRSNRGFFNTAAGTIKNVTFVNPDVNSAGNNIAVVAATVPVASSAARFNRVFIEGGSVSGATSVGGIVGQLSDNANAITYFENCFNSANITASGAGHAGGMLGRSGSSGSTSSTGTELYVSHCGNEGNITASNASSNTQSGVGGIVGCIDGGPTTVKFSYNTGTVTGHAGIVGLVRVDSGKVSISNCYNDAVVKHNTRLNAAIVLRANANTEIWAENNWYNTRLFSGHAYARGHTPDAGSSIVGGDILEPGRFTDTPGQGAVGSLDISTQEGKEELLDFLNTGSEVGTGFAIISGEIRLLALTRTRTMTFLPMGAPGNAFQHHLSPDALEDFVLPAVGETRIGHRFGFTFSGWEYDGNIYAEGFNFPLSSTSPMNIEFEAVWDKIDYTVTFHESPTALLVGASIPPVFNIDQGGLSLVASNWDLLNRPVWMIKKAGTEFPAGNDASWVPLSNQNGFPFSQMVLEDADGIAFLTSYADASNDVMIKLVSHNSINSHLINVTSENEDGGAFGFTLTGSNSVIQVSLSFGHFSIPNTSTIDKFHIETTNDYYEFVRIEVEPVTGSPFTLSAPDANGFLYGDFSGLVTGAQIHVVFAKIPFKLDVTTNLVTEQYPKPEVPANLLNNHSLANVFVDENTNIFIEAKQESFSGLNAFRFIGFKISTAEGEFVPIPFPTTTENYGGELFAVINSIEWIDASWLNSYLYEDENLDKIVRIIAEYIPLYRVIIGGGDVLSVDGTIASVDGTFDVVYSYYDAVDAITVWPLHNTFFVPEGSTVNVETRTNIFFEDAATDSSFFYHLARFDGLLDDERFYTIGDSMIATLCVNTIRTVNPIFTPRPFNVTFETRDSNGKTIPNVNSRDFSIVKVSPEHATQLRIGDIFTVQAPENLPALSGYRFEGFTVVGITGYLPSNFHIESEDFFLDNMNSRTLNVFITARYTNLFDLKVGVASASVDMGNVKVYKDSEKPGNLVYEGSGRNINGELPLLGQFEQSETFIIVAVPSHGFEFASFGGIYDDGTENPAADNRLTIRLTEIRTITANFRALPITINEKLSKKGWGTTSADIEDQLFAGGKIYIFANPGFGSEVKSWSINGVNIKKLGNVERFGNMIEVTLTSDWLYENSDELKSHVKFGFTLTFILLVIVPSILIPLFGLAFLAYFLNLQRKKKIIKAALLADKRARAGFNQHSLVVDAREGKAIGGVSDEAVQAAMKEKKKKKDKK